MPVLLEWLEQREPDVVCLQETKVVDQDFPREELARHGYIAEVTGQKTYNGVAILTRLPAKDVHIGLLGDNRESDRRFIAASIAGFRIMSAYIPNGKDVENPAFPEKLRWLERLKQTLVAERALGLPLVLCGDFNVAFDERDVYNPKAFEGRLHFHPAERQALRELLALGLLDAFRLHHQEPAQYSWWDYRGGSLDQNRGLRIDYAFIDETLRERCLEATHDVELRRKERPSDHVPVVVRFSDR